MYGREWLEHRQHQEAVERVLAALDAAIEAQAPEDREAVREALRRRYEHGDLHARLRQQEIAQGAAMSLPYPSEPRPRGLWPVNPGFLGLP